jgi:hypothetical protein
LLVTLAIGATPAKAIMTMELSGNAGSSIVNFLLYGSSTAATTFGSPITGVGFDIKSGPNLFPSAIGVGNYGIFQLLSGGGTVSNQTQGTSIYINTLFLQDESLFGSERFGVGSVYEQSYYMRSGDIMSWNGSGSIDLSTYGLNYDDINKGECQADWWGMAGKIIVDGSTNNAPVPEPGTIALLGLGMAGLAVYGKRRSNKA